MGRRGAFSSASHPGRLPGRAPRQALWAVACAAAGVLLTPTPAVAFCRSTTCDPLDDAEACRPDERGCPTSGAPLFWPDACVTYAVQELGSPLRGITAEQTDAAMRRGFAAWLNAECPGGGRPSIGVVPLGSASCDLVEFNPSEGGRAGSPNANLVIFRDDSWRYADEGSVIARTCLTFDANTGALFDADIEINSFEVDLSASDQIITNDLQGILTHEIGHFLGLGHSTVSGATMQEDYERADLGTRTLSSDDQVGICSLYAPEGDSAVVCPPETGPRGGYSRECDPPVANDAGCLSVAGRRAPDPLGPAMALALALLLSRTRRRWRH